MTSDPVWYDLPSGRTTPTMRVQQIRTALHRGEWWIAARTLTEAREQGDHIMVSGSWCGYLELIPMSRMHSSRLLRLEAAGLAVPGARIKPSIQVLQGRVAA